MSADHLINIRELRNEIAPPYDFCLVPERESLPKYRAVGANLIHLKMVVNPRVYRSYDLPLKYNMTLWDRGILIAQNIVAYLQMPDTFMKENRLSIRRLTDKHNIPSSQLDLQNTVSHSTRNEQKK